MSSSVCAAPCAKVSHRASSDTACPRRLYYTRYYTEAPLSAAGGLARRIGNAARVIRVAGCPGDRFNEPTRRALSASAGMWFPELVWTPVTRSPLRSTPRTVTLRRTSAPRPGPQAGVAQRRALRPAGTP